MYDYYKQYLREQKDAKSTEANEETIEALHRINAEVKGRSEKIPNMIHRIAEEKRKSGLTVKEININRRVRRTIKRCCPESYPYVALDAPVLFIKKPPVAE